MSGKAGLACLAGMASKTGKADRDDSSIGACFFQE